MTASLKYLPSIRRMLVRELDFVRAAQRAQTNRFDVYFLIFDTVEYAGWKNGGK